MWACRREKRDGEEGEEIDTGKATKTESREKETKKERETGRKGKREKAWNLATDVEKGRVWEREREREREGEGGREKNIQEADRKWLLPKWSHSKF